MAIQLQDGKQYVTRSGVVVKAEERDIRTTYCFNLTTTDGQYLASVTKTGDEFDTFTYSDNDIVGEYNQEPITEWKFQVGSTIKNRYQASGLYVRAHVKVLNEADSRSESLEYYCYDIASKQHSLYSKDAIEERYNLVKEMEEC